MDKAVAHPFIKLDIMNICLLETHNIRKKKKE